MTINETEIGKKPNYSRCHMKTTRKRLISEYTKAIGESHSQRNEHRKTTTEINEGVHERVLCYL